MRFKLASSPFENIHKFVDDTDLFSYMDPKLRSLLWSYRKEKRSSLPPSCLVVGPLEGSFLFGWSYSTSASFLAASRYEAKHVGATLAVLLSEVTSIVAPDVSLLAVEAQRPGQPATRSFMNVQSPGWTDLSCVLTEKEELEAMDPVDRDILLSSEDSAVLGLSSAFGWILPEP